MKTTFARTLALTGLLGLAAASVATAGPISISGSIGGAPTGVFLVNFDNLTPGSTASATATGPTGSVNVSFASGGQVASGAQSGVYAPPFLSGGNGNGFGPGSTNQSNGVDTTPYLTTGIGSVTLDFGSSAALKYFGMLWGSVDTYNTLKFYDGLTLIDTVTGSNVIASPNGDQGANGTVYVNMTSSVAFNKVVALSSNYAFEFDNVAYSQNQSIGSIPDGGMTLTLLGTALSGLALLRRRSS